MFSGSLVAIVTPMRPDGAVDLEAWARLLEFHQANGTNGIVIGGTTGESATLREAELRELTQRACAQLRGRVAVIAGAGRLAVAAPALVVVRMARRAAVNEISRGWTGWPARLPLSGIRSSSAAPWVTALNGLPS